MLLRNKNRIAYLSAVSLIFSYAELFIPKIFPFFKIGLSNIAVLSGLNLSFADFIILCLVKSFTNSLISGTLLSPFFIVSVCQSLCSGLFMFGLYRFRRYFSVYSISVCGSMVSAVVQVYLSALYIGFESLVIISPMLAFSFVAGFITAFLSRFFSIPEETPVLGSGFENQHEKLKIKNVVFLSFIILILISVFLVSNIYYLLAAMTVSFLLQFISGRKIKILPHVFIWIFMILMSFLTPNGKILFSLGPIALTEGSLLDAVKKAMTLSSAACLSQASLKINIPSGDFLRTVINYYTALQNNFNLAEGNLFVKLKQTLSSQKL